MTGRAVNIGIIQINAGSGYALTEGGQGVSIPACFVQDLLDKGYTAGKSLRANIIPRAGGGEIAPFEFSGIHEEEPSAAPSAA